MGCGSSDGACLECLGRDQLDGEARLLGRQWLDRIELGALNSAVKSCVSSEELLGLCAWGVVFSVPIAIDENGVGGALYPRRLGVVGTYGRGLSQKGSVMPGPVAMAMRWVSWAGRGRGEGEVGFLDLSGGGKVAGEDSVAVGEEFQPIGPNPGRP